MKEKIILLNPPRVISSVPIIRDFYCSFSSKAGYYWPSQDLLSLSGILRTDYDVKVIDAVPHNINEKDCFEMISGMHAQALIFTTGMASFQDDLRFIESVKNKINLKIIASSSVFRFNGEEILSRYPFLDALITDFTDKSIIAYLHGDYSSCVSLLSREGKNIYMEKEEQGQEFSIGTPLYESFFNKNNRIPLFGNQPFAITFSSFGCKFNCSFCVASKIRIKFRNLDEVVSDLGYIRRLGIKNVFFVDPLFTAEKTRIMQLSGRIKSLGLDWICNSHPATICDEEVLMAMKESGCKAVMIGVESGDDEMLKRCAKGTNTEQIKQVFVLCRKLKIKTLAYFIIGLPGETKCSAQKTIEFAKRIQCNYASFGYATPDIGTDLAKKANFTGNCFDPSLEPVLLNENLTKEETIKLFRDAYRNFYLRPGYILRMLAGVHSLADLGLLLKEGSRLLRRNIL
ncbi:MAG: radical SAM protein [Candidatus Omnitrophota bacterium]